MRPLYKTDTPPHKTPDSNLGLWYDKFCDTWEADFKSLGKDGGGKRDWIHTVTGYVGNARDLSEACERITGLLEHHRQEPQFYKTTYAFVTGLGREHPVENGFAWHHTLGTPYLPGSSVKGMVRAWAEQ